MDDTVEGRDAGIGNRTVAGDGRTSGDELALLQRAEACFRNAIEAAPSGMVMVDEQGVITLVNSEVERIFGYERAELLGQKIEMLIPERFRAAHPAKRQAFFARPRLRPIDAGLDLYGRRKDGSEFPADVRLSPIDTPTGVAVLAAILDATSRKRMEASLREQVEQRDRFLATLSHELRNPLAAILNAVSMLHRVAGDRASVLGPCGVIRRQSALMATLLDDLLDVSRGTQGKIKLRREVCDLTVLAREAIETVGPLIASHHHDVDFEVSDGPLWVDVDRARVLQILQNLLTNAIKYTPDGGQIEIAVEREGREGVIRVRDNGRGIAPELLGSIFDMFVQSDETLDRSEGGMGVGLTLVRSLVELHQGTVSVFSEGRGRGSEFVVSLPLTTKRPAQVGATTTGDDPEMVRIVLVEDSRDAREMLRALLVFEGYHVTAAADGPRGFDAIIKELPDVALLDIGLPGLDGYQLARKVRERFSRDEIRLIALSGYGRDEDCEAMLEAGFDDHLVKPVRFEQLKSLLNRRRAARDCSRGMR